MSEATRIVTADELERLPHDDHRYELVEGRLVRMSPVGMQHGGIVVRLAILVGRHVQDHDLGFVGTEVGFKLAANPDTVRAPDLAFIRKGRIPVVHPSGFWPGPPDLAVEVLSPGERPFEVRSKIDDYLAAGAMCVVIVDPAGRRVTVHRRRAPSTTFEASDDLIDIGDVVSGFRCRLGEIFADPI